MKFLIINIFLLSCLLFNGCSIVMAVRQPPKKDLNILSTGTARNDVIGRLGEPFSTEKKEDDRIDLYQFRQGYSTINKTGRALFHATADVFSFGIWEAVGTPSEKIFDGKRMTIKIVYDKQDLIKETIFLEGK